MNNTAITRLRKTMRKMAKGEEKRQRMEARCYVRELRRELRESIELLRKEGRA